MDGDTSSVARLRALFGDKTAVSASSASGESKPHKAKASRVSALAERFEKPSRSAPGEDSAQRTNSSSSVAALAAKFQTLPIKSGLTWPCSATPSERERDEGQPSAAGELDHAVLRRPCVTKQRRRSSVPMVFDPTS